jgi:hypothetical protein
VHPTEAFDDARLRQTMFFLGKQLDDFLVWQEIQNDASLLELSKLRLYRRRQLEKPFKSSLEGIRKLLDQNPRRNSRYLRDVSMIELETYSYKSAHRRDQLLNLQETSHSLDLAYLAEKLRISCLMLSHQAVYRNVVYEHGPLERLLAYIVEYDLLREPAIAVYYHCYLASTDRNNQSHFTELLRLITDQSQLFPVSELRELYLFALNYCIYWSNLGSRDYLYHMFRLYQKGFDERILFENGVVSRFTFFNAVGNAIKIGEFGWAETFIHDIKPFIEERHREAIVLLSLARLYFEQHEFDKAQKVLHNYDSEDLLHVLFARRLLVKIYFEDAEFEALESLLDSMSVYLKRKESLDASRQEGYRNFLRFMKKIVKAWPLTETKHKSIRQALDDTPVVLEREWLQQILEVR